MIQISRLLRLRVARVGAFSRGGVVVAKNPTFIRSFSSKEQQIESHQTVEHESNLDDDIPWYLRDDSSSPLIEKKHVPLPSIPEEAPGSVSEFVNLLAYDYGFDNIDLFDLSVLPDDHSFSIKNQNCRYILIATGKSEKHIYKAASELRNYIKHTYKLIPAIEGMVSQAVSPAAGRRMLKRARKGPLATDNDYGKAANSWVMCNTDVDGVQLHLLTEQRRKELMLEELWCREEDAEKYQPEKPSSMDSDDIFIGIRRLFHTMTPFATQRRLFLTTTPFRAYSTASQDVSLQQLYNRLANEESDISQQKLNVYKQSIDDVFTGTLEDFNLKFKCYKLLHIVNPSVVKFKEVTDVILQKHSSLLIAIDSSVNLDEEKVHDIIAFTTLLLDSPEIPTTANETSSIHTTYLLDQLSQFISKIARFSNINLLSNNQFIAMLWRLTFTENEGFLGSNIVDRAISDGIINQYSSEKLITLDNKRARDILDLLKHESKRTNKEFSWALKELIIFTYGNGANWMQFWKKWDIYFGLLNRTPSIDNWVRLVVYLAMRNDSTAMIHFLNNYWDQTSSVGGSFLSNFDKHHRQFNSPEDIRAFKLAMTTILKSVKKDENLANFNLVKTFVDSL